MKKPIVLIIRDGWGISPNGKAKAQEEGNATLLSKTPFHDHLYETYPWGHLSGSGEDVGLPAGQMGNSEVGHLNLGAGRIVYQEITRINKAIQDGSFFQNQTLQKVLTTLKTNEKALHLIGLISDGGVHSHQDHLVALVKAAKEKGLNKIYIHAITDGRDTSPTGGVGYLEKLQSDLNRVEAGQIITLIGRYYAMDRDNRWERTKLAYDLIMRGETEDQQISQDPVSALKTSYENDITDEFVKPHVFLNSNNYPSLSDGDGILFFNFRADRARQLSLAWLDPHFTGFKRPAFPKLVYTTITQYDVKYDQWGVHVINRPQSMDNILGEVLSQNNKKQMRMAETEKYPHVTYFFNGGREEPFEGEDREVTSSPKVATYDLQPEMSALELTEAVLRRLDSNQYDVMILNYANPDMVGHTGILDAVIKSVETIDTCVKKVVGKVLAMDGICLVTADHGNCEKLLTEEGKTHTAHTTNLVHFIYVAKEHKNIQIKDGILADVAPTILDLFEIKKPNEMTGNSLLH